MDIDHAGFVINNKKQDKWVLRLYRINALQVLMSS